MTFEDEHEDEEEHDEESGAGAGAGSGGGGRDDGFTFPRRPAKESDHKDKIPALIVAARKARDDETKLLLLQKAKQIDPGALEPYLLRAAIFARRGDERGERSEYHAAMQADPTHWFVRFQLLNLEYPVERDLKHACGIVRDLAWEKGVTERFLNAGRGSLRSESELSHDEAILGHLVLAGGGGGHGVVDLSRVSANGNGDVLVLNALEPWLQRFDPDGILQYGTDLWLADDIEPIQEPCDVALCADGSALVCAPRPGGVWRLEPDGTWVRRGLKGVVVERPIAVAVREAAGAGGGDVFVFCGANGAVVRTAAAGGGARDVWNLGLEEPLSEASLAAARDGTAYALAGGVIYVLAKGGTRPRASFSARPATAAGSGERGAARSASGERAAARTGSDERSGAKSGERGAAKPAPAPDDPVPAKRSRKGSGSGEQAAAGARGGDAPASPSRGTRPRASAKSGAAWQGGGIAVDPIDGTLIVADAGRDEVVRLDALGNLIERICDGKVVKRPLDVACDGKGRVVIADTGHARVIHRSRGGSDWSVLFGGAGLAPPPRAAGARAPVKGRSTGAKKARGSKGAAGPEDESGAPDA